MLRRGVGVDRFCFPLLFKAVGRIKGLVEGVMIHGLAVKMGFADDPFVETGLVGMYASCGKIDGARMVFDRMLERDIVTWSIMIDGYDCVIGIWECAFGFGTCLISGYLFNFILAFFICKILLSI